MNFYQFIYIEKLPGNGLKVLLENVLGISMKDSNSPGWKFYSDQKDMGVSVEDGHFARAHFVVDACINGINSNIRIIVNSPGKYLVKSDVAAVKCVNAILNAYDTDLVFMADDDTPRLIRCRGKVMIHRSGKTSDANFWNRPSINLSELLTVPYSTSEFTIVKNRE